MIRGIVLAAGMGRRMGFPKALATLGEETFHARAIAAFRCARLGIVTVVNPAVARALPSPARDQEGGMFSSVQLGVAEARRLGAGSAVLLPVDHPFVTGDDIRIVIDALESGANIVGPTHGGRRGHPIGISHAIMVEIDAARMSGSGVTV
ncbi:MAG: NTP transferase domain-containing protein, partial [Vicinamibacteria bacterium]